MFKVNNKVVVLLLLTYFTPFFSNFIVNFEEINARWVSFRIVKSLSQSLFAALVRDLLHLQ